MLRKQGYKFEAQPNGEQLRNLRRFVGACRFVYNKALALNKDRYEEKAKRLGYAGLCALLPRWKTEFAWLSDVPAQALQQSLKDLERGFSNFFEKRAEFPAFHKKGRKDSFRIPQGFQVDNPNGRIQLPKIGWMRYRKSREIVGTPKHVTVSLVHGKAFLSIQTEREVATPMHPSKSSVGLDWGIKRFYTLSNGEYEEPLSPLQQFAVKVAKLQRVLARKKKFACVQCGLTANADCVAAVNIKEAGLALIACSQSSAEVRPSWQAPTEGIRAYA